MDILTSWLRSYLPALDVSDAQLAEDLTLRGIAVEGVFAVEGGVGGSRFEMDITTNRVDAMNHYGVAREAAAIYNVALKPIAEAAPVEPGSESPDAGHPDSWPASWSSEGFPVRIEAGDLCGRFTARVIRGVKGGACFGVDCGVFCCAGAEADFGAGGRYELWLDGDGAAYACVRPGQDCWRDCGAAGTRGREADATGWDGEDAGCGRPGGC